MYKVSDLGRRLFLLACLNFCSVSAQSLKGKVVEERTKTAIPGVFVKIAGTSLEEKTGPDGYFHFTHSLPFGDYLLVFSKNTYIPKTYPVVFSDDDKDLGVIALETDVREFQVQTSSIVLSHVELDEEDGGYSNVSGLLQASRDVFLNAAAFDFSPAFFRPRGYDSENSKLLINGIEMNKIFNGRPLWSNWGGLNDVQRNQVFSMGLSPSDYSFGGLAGTTNIIMRASQYKEGGKISYAIANRAYTGRVMASYASGLGEEGWAYTLAVAKRFAEESYVDGTVYDANSFFVAVEKKLGEDHSLNLTGFYTPNHRGKNSPNTQEVYDLKGSRYNSYWGYQNGEIRNSRVRRVEEPVLMLNHYWRLSEKTEVNSGVAYQFGRIGDSRIDYGGSRALTGETGETAFIGGGSSPDPAYYQRLPSYFFRNSNEPDYQAAYIAEKDFEEHGQIDWPAMYLSNFTSTTAGGNALYVLYEDRMDDKKLIVNSNFRSEISQHLVFTGSVDFTRLRSENFASVLDLLGGSGFLDVDSFSDGDRAQNDLLHPNKIVSEGEKIKYNYELTANSMNGFVQAQFYYTNFDFYAALQLSQKQYQRMGLFKNGNFPNNSFGESDSPAFTDYGVKTGITYKLSGRHLFDLNVAAFTRAPTLRSSFSNVRQNNEVVRNLTNEKVVAADVGYIFRTRHIRGRLTTFYSQFSDGIEISFFYADGLSGLGRNSTTAFVQEVLTGVDKRHTGLETGIEVLLNSTMKLKLAASLGEYLYANNPRLYLTSDSFNDALELGTANLENYRIPGGPQRAAQLGFEYRDPSYWWFSTTANYFSHAYIDIGAITRSRNFVLDSDGLPIVGFDEDVARTLLKQERLDDYFLVNLVGGKSWKVKNNFIGIFGSINNILNADYKTGGYEQTRNVNYELLKNDQGRDQPLFDPKYWFGLGTTYYAHIYYRF